MFPCYVLSKHARGWMNKCILVSFELCTSFLMLGFASMANFMPHFITTQHEDSCSTQTCFTASTSSSLFVPLRGHVDVFTPSGPRTGNTQQPQNTWHSIRVWIKRDPFCVFLTDKPSLPFNVPSKPWIYPMNTGCFVTATLCECVVVPFLNVTLIQDLDKG